MKNQHNDYVMINKYIGIQKPVSPYMKPNGRDAVYTVLFLLISTGVFLNLRTLMKKPVEYAMTLLPESYVEATYNAPQPRPTIQYVERTDSRVIKLKAFLEEKNSPLTEYSEFIVNESDKYGIDYTLIVSISGIESNYGVQSRCYNAWGLGGTKFMCFNSWEQSISYVSELLGTSYRKKMIAGIQNTYCPSYECNPDWVHVVMQSAEQILSK